MTALELERIRPMIESEIDRLIAALDLIDADPDLEADGSDEEMPDAEPELGWTATQARTGKYGGEDPYAYEPSLGSTNDVNQTHWWRGRLDDCKEQHDGREPDCAPQDAGSNFSSVGASEILQVSKAEP
jgi:hypothetical protein